MTKCQQCNKKEADHILDSWLVNGLPQKLCADCVADKRKTAGSYIIDTVLNLRKIE